MPRLATTAALCLALASACAGAPADAPAELEAPTAPEAPAEAELWLAPDAPGYAEQAAWGLPLKEGFQVVELAPEAFAAECAALPSSGGSCGPSVVGAADLQGNSVLLRAGLLAPARAKTLLHEMGHVLRGHGGHIPAEAGCPTVAEARTGAQAQHAMCEVNGTPELTPEDFDFVLAGRGPLGWL